MAYRIASGSAKTRGFTLIELIVVMSIIATLLTIAVPRYFKSLQRAKEAVLRQDLSVLRDALDKYNADQGRYAESLENLVERGYLRSIPQDPFTKSTIDWIVTTSEDSASPGIVDLHSSSKGVALDGTTLLEW
jgi:general secretion pathway protein G